MLSKCLHPKANQRHRKIALFAFLWSVGATLIPVLSQADTLTLEACYSLARENYPLVRQHELISQSAEYSIENASKNNLPQIVLYGQLTYQSDVPHIPIELPGSPVPLIPKDQYKVFAEINQVIYDGGATSLQKEGRAAESMVKQQGLEVELYKLHERVNQLYFGILLIREQISQTDLFRKDIDSGLRKTTAAIENGIALKSSGDVLRVELLKNRQRTIELEAMHKAYKEMLGLMINRPLNETSVLVLPPGTSAPEEIRRPEIAWFDYQRQNLSLQDDLLHVQNRPKINLFLQGGLGRPGLNLFDDQFAGFYYGGLRFAWPLAGFYVEKNETANIEIRRQEIMLQKETFLFNTQLETRKENQEIQKLEELLATDDEIVNLRATIKETALNQLENGVITSSDYLREANAEDAARQNKILHEIQLRMAQYSLRTTLGH